MTQAAPHLSHNSCRLPERLCGAQRAVPRLTRTVGLSFRHLHRVRPAPAVSARPHSGFVDVHSNCLPDGAAPVPTGLHDSWRTRARNNDSATEHTCAREATKAHDQQTYYSTGACTVVTIECAAWSARCNGVSRRCERATGRRSRARTAEQRDSAATKPGNIRRRCCTRCSCAPCDILGSKLALWPSGSAQIR